MLLQVPLRAGCDPKLPVAPHRSRRRGKRGSERMSGDAIRSPCLRFQYFVIELGGYEKVHGPPGRRVLRSTRDAFQPLCRHLHCRKPLIRNPEKYVAAADGRSGLNVHGVTHGDLAAKQSASDVKLSRCRALKQCVRLSCWYAFSSISSFGPKALRIQ